MSDQPKPPAKSTLLTRQGHRSERVSGSLKPVLHRTSTFVFDTAAQGKAFFAAAYGHDTNAVAGDETGMIYTRINNPDFEVLEARLATADDSEAALAFSSGMAAISTALLTYLRPGDSLAYSAQLYGGTESFLQKILKPMDIHMVEFADDTDLEAACAAAEKLGPLKVIYTETPANPTGKLVDLAAVAAMAAAHETRYGHRPVTMTDNTFLGPLWQQPFAHGIDLSLYSLTKYVGGHSDLIAGAVTGGDDRVAEVRRYRTALGCQVDVETCNMLMRSLETLDLRMTKAADNAAAVARYLEGHPKVSHVTYLGLLGEDDPSYPLFSRQCTSAGAVFSFDVIGGEAEAFALLDRLNLIKLTVSFGSTESLMCAPYVMTHSDLSAELKARLGINPSTLRVSVGIEDKDDLIADLAQALDKV